MIGDKDPEDAYDASDPIGVRLARLAKIIEAIRVSSDERREARRVDALRLIANLEIELHSALTTVAARRRELENL
jgi:hypothetical protein